MGDRRMAELKTSEGSLYFYTHNRGFVLPELAQLALIEAKGRRSDESYALRSVVDSLINSSGSRDNDLNSGLMLQPNAEDEYNQNQPSVIIDLQTWECSTVGENQ
jgi:hypothetical protein